MSQSSKRHTNTFLQHAAMAPFDEVTGAAPVPLPSMRTSTVRFRNLEALEGVAAQKKEGKRIFTYGRSGMDTHGALESIFCELETAKYAYLASSGMAAITLAFLSFLKQGDHVIVADCSYGPVRRLDAAVLSRFGIKVSYCRAVPDVIKQNLTPQTRMLYVESPGSLLLEMLDLPALAQFATEHNLIMATDNTWGLGFYNPLELGVDVSVVAGTKYLNGHSDLLLGAVMVNNDELAAQLDSTHYALGYSISADDAWLAIRGARTLPLRLSQSAESGLKVAKWLRESPIVDKIYYPALDSDDGHLLWKRDCKGSNGLMSIRLKTSHKNARNFVNSLKLFGIGFSWGGFESLVQLVDKAALVPHEYWGNSDYPLVRLYVGLEHVDDLIADLQQAITTIS